jgi:hypothetical protein
VQWLSVQRRDQHGVVKLISLNLVRTTGEDATTERLDGAARLRAVLTDEYGLQLDDIDADEWNDLYRRVREAQDEYERSLESVDG